MNLKKMIIKDIKKILIPISSLNKCDPIVIVNKNIKLGHYQLNNLIKIANILNIQLCELSNVIIGALKKKNTYQNITYSQPGFINIFISYNYISIQLEKVFVSSRLGIKLTKPQNIVIDYSSPNIAKEMHVGHLRSTIIGDVIVRILFFLGHNVIRVNHIGDWGTQFGMLIAYLEDAESKKILKNDTLSLSTLEKLYCEAKKKYDTDHLFSKKSRNYVVKLQNEDPYCYNIWKKLVSVTMIENHKIYKRLNVTLTKEDTMGESLYNKILPNIVKDLKNKNIAIEKNGSTIVFLKEFQNRLGKPMGVVVQKKDTGFLYSTTEIACFKYRCEVLHADRIIYYTDVRQHQHLLQAWTISRKANYIPKHLLFEHHSFGMMLSKNKQPFRTRDGDTIKLSALLDEATERAMKLIKKKKPNLSTKKLIHLSEVIGIGAVKYADLSKNRNTNYIFDWNTMLSFEGNTAPYIQYAYTRILSLLKKSTISIKKLKTKIFLHQESEINLAIKILEFEEIVFLISQKGTPHIMCQYLYQLASHFSSFYENCSILFPKTIKICKSRLKLSILTAKTLKKGLNMLGIKTVKKM